MKSRTTSESCLSAALLVASAVGFAQDARRTPAQPMGRRGHRRNDPRVGLKAGLPRRRRRRAATWSWWRTCRSRRASSIRRTSWPATPIATPDAGARKCGDAAARRRRPRRPSSRPPRTAAPPAPPAGRGGPRGLDFANSDLAFRGTHMFVGNFNGFNTYDIETPKKPRLLASVVCPGGQGDVSVYGNLLFMSVEQTRGRVDCGTQGVAETVSAERFRGVRIFDISDISKPKQVAAVQTCRGSHTHTLVTDPNDKANIYVYGSGTSTVRSGEELAGCSGDEPDGGSEHRALQHRRDQGAARRAAEGEDRQPAAHLRRSRRPARSPACGRAATTARARRRRARPTSATTSPCIPEVGLAAGACSGNGILLDISDPVHPKRLDAGQRQELRLLALGDVQQRRHEGDLHRRVGRRHAAALPRDRPAQLGRRRDLRHRRQQAAVRAATTRCRRRRPSRRTASRTTAR